MFKKDDEAFCAQTLSLFTRGVVCALFSWKTFRDKCFDEKKKRI